MRARIETAEMEGFLAYDGDEVVGWMNAQPYHKLRFACARMRIPDPALPVPRARSGGDRVLRRRAGVSAARCRTRAPRRGARELLAARHPDRRRVSVERRAQTTARRPTSITARIRCSSRRDSTHDRDARERHGRAQAAVASAWASGAPTPHAAAARARGALRARDRIREPAAVLAVDPARSRARRSGRSRRGRCASRASTSSPTSSRTCRSASSSRCGRGARRRARAPPSRSPAACTLSFALETLQMFLPPRDASLIDLAANTAGALLGGMAGASLVRAERTRKALSALRAQRIFLPRHARRLRPRAARAVAGRADQSGHPAFRRDVRRRAERRHRRGTPRARYRADAHRGRGIGVPAPGRRAVPRAAAARAPLHRRRGAAADRRRARRQGRRRRAHAEAGRVGELAEARRVDRHDRGPPRPARRRVPAAAGAGRDLRDRAARVAAAPGRSRVDVPSRARAAHAVQLALRPPAQFQRAHANRAARVADRGGRVAVRARRAAAVGRARERTL